MGQPRDARETGPRETEVVVSVYHQKPWKPLEDRGLDVARFHGNTWLRCLGLPDSASCRLKARFVALLHCEGKEYA